MVGEEASGGVRAHSGWTSVLIRFAIGLRKG
jgi:hypothetical protein